MQVSIITINYNSSLFTIKLVESIFKHIGKIIDYEIIITDNASKDRDYENLVKKLPRDERIKLFRNKDIYTFKIENKRHFKINNLELCKTYEEILEETPEGPVFNMPNFPKRTQVKDKKYSILRLYD